MNFCSNCGAPATGGAYCANCGQQLTAPSGQTTPAQATSGPPGQGGAAAQQKAAPGARPGASINPFADIPVVDYGRDAIALVLLLVSFGMPWDAVDSATGKVYVILATLLSIVSLTLPYLKRGGILPATWGTAQLRLTRLAANAPYVVVVLVTFVLAYVGEDGGDGVGVGIAFGLAGALLAAQGRQAEQEPAPGDGALWRAVTIGLAGLFALLSVLSAVLFLIDFAENLDWAPITLRLLVVVFFLALVAMPTMGLVRGQPGWRDVLVLLAIVGLFVALWQLGAERTLSDAWNLRALGPAMLLYPALGAAAASAGLSAIDRPVAGATRWVTMSIRLFQLVAIVGVFGAVMYAVQLIDIEDGRGSAITVLVLHLLVVVAALVGRNALVGAPNQGRAVAIGAGLVFAVLGVVIVSVLGASDLAIVGLFDAAMVSVMWWFALAILLALTTPKAVRDEFGPVSVSAAGFGNGSAAKSSQTPAAPPVASGPPAAGTAAPTSTPAATRTPAEAAEPAKPEASKPEASKPDASKPADTARPAGSAAAAGAATPAEKSPSADVSASAGSAAPADAATPKDEPKAEAATAAQPADASPAPEPVDATAVLPTTAADGPAGADNGADGEDEVVREAGFDSRTAADPNTPLQTLADIAAQAPSLRPYVAANPSTYPELVEWLRHLGDPAVDAALRKRGR